MIILKSYRLKLVFLKAKSAQLIVINLVTFF